MNYSFILTCKRNAWKLHFKNSLPALPKMDFVKYFKCKQAKIQRFLDNLLESTLCILNLGTSKRSSSEKRDGVYRNLFTANKMYMACDAFTWPPTWFYVLIDSKLLLLLKVIGILLNMQSVTNVRAFINCFLILCGLLELVV